MAQKAIEIILMRQLAGCLGTPVLLFDLDGNLVFSNRPAEMLLGWDAHDSAAPPCRCNDPLRDATREDGTTLPDSEHPLHRALRNGQSGHACLWLPCARGERRRLEATAIALDTDGVRRAGAMLFLWETPAP